jgi:hypothetical protein
VTHEIVGDDMQAAVLTLGPEDEILALGDLIGGDR